MSRRRPESDFSAEIQAHIALEAERLQAEGLSQADADAAARRAFGNPTAAEERYYESGRWQWWDQVTRVIMLRKASRQAQNTRLGRSGRCRR